jgi:hypothetical protein
MIVPQSASAPKANSHFFTLVGEIAAIFLLGADPSPAARLLRNSSRPVGVMTWKA